jgi:hypothetical protein
MTKNNEEEPIRFNVENPFKVEGKKPRAPASKTSPYRVRLQTLGIYNDLSVSRTAAYKRYIYGNPNQSIAPTQPPATGLRFATSEVGLYTYIDEFGSQLNIRYEICQ